MNALSWCECVRVRVCVCLHLLLAFIGIYFWYSSCSPLPELERGLSAVGGVAGLVWFDFYEAGIWEIYPWHWEYSLV